MAEYIEREKAIDELWQYIVDPKKAISDHPDDIEKFNDGIDTAISVLSTLPAADVKPVVRCKDCREWHRNYLAINGGMHGCELFQDFTRPDDFCSFAKRRVET